MNRGVLYFCGGGNSSIPQPPSQLSQPPSQQHHNNNKEVGRLIQCPQISAIPPSTSNKFRQAAWKNARQRHHQSAGRLYNVHKFPQSHQVLIINFDKLPGKMHGHGSINQLDG